jgi:hypothetical protein
MLVILNKCIIFVETNKQLEIMETLYIHNGVAYLSKDLAIINGADRLSLYELKLNETQTEDIEIKVNLQQVLIYDDYENELVFDTNEDLEYLAISHSFDNLSTKTTNRIEQACIDYSVDEIFNRSED